MPTWLSLSKSQRLMSLIPPSASYLNIAIVQSEEPSHAYRKARVIGRLGSTFHVLGLDLGHHPYTSAEGSYAI